MAASMTRASGLRRGDLLGLAFFALLLIAFFVFGMWYRHVRWINPDEGAHLMDAVLILRGLVPSVDFESRQPLYVLILAASLELFGAKLAAGRLVPLLATLVGAVVVFGIGARLRDLTTGVVAGTLYLVLPYSILFGTVVKTEPVVNVFTGMGVLLAWISLDTKTSTGRYSLLAASGAMMAFAYYIRESALAATVATGLCLLLLNRRTFRELAQRVAAYLAGYAVVVAAALAYYGSRAPLTAFSARDLNPLAWVWASIGDRLRASADVLQPDLVEQGAALATTSFRDQQWSSTSFEIIRSVQLHWILIVGGAVTLLVICLPSVWQRYEGGRHTVGLILLGTWTLVLTLAYTIHVRGHAWYPAYTREFYVPLAPVAAFGLTAAYRELAGALRSWGCAALILGFVSCQVTLWVLAPTRQGTFYLALAAYAVAVWVIARAGPGAPRDSVPRAGVRLGQALTAGLLAYATMRLAAQALGGSGLAPGLAIVGGLGGATAVWWATHRHLAERRLGVAAFGVVSVTALTLLSAGQLTRLDWLSFHNPWSPSTLRSTVEDIRRLSGPNDTLLSGGVIWSVESGRGVYANISHPLALRVGTTREVIDGIEHGLRDAPPKLVILDGYTERTFGAVTPTLYQVLAEDYELVGQHIGSKYPVRLYRRSPPVVTGGQVP